MKNRKTSVRLLVLLLAAVFLLGGCTANALETAKSKKNTAAPAVTMEPTPVPEPAATPGPLEEAQRSADYLFEYGKLLLLAGKSIGGDYFGNYEKKLPVVEGRKYYEADCFYQGGRRNEFRIIYSNDGHVWYTGDHYNTFTELFPTEKE